MSRSVLGSDSTCRICVGEVQGAAVMDILLVDTAWTKVQATPPFPPQPSPLILQWNINGHQPTQTDTGVLQARPVAHTRPQAPPPRSAQDATPFVPWRSHGPLTMVW